MTGEEFLAAKAQADAIRRMTEQLARDDAMCEEINKQPQSKLCGISYFVI
jgi:hypothetical protein